jgi:hypothetical protein
MPLDRHPATVLPPRLLPGVLSPAPPEVLADADVQQQVGLAKDAVERGSAISAP